MIELTVTDVDCGHHVLTSGVIVVTFVTGSTISQCQGVPHQLYSLLYRPSLRINVARSTSSTSMREEPVLGTKNSGHNGLSQTALNVWVYLAIPSIYIYN